MKAVLAAFQFLTILPLPRGLDLGERALGRSTWFFPVVGLAAGAAVAAADCGVSFLLPASPASVVTVLLLLGCSGGLHIDGLADTADGFFSSRPRERILEIMKDSRSGPMGVAAIVVALLFKTALVASLPNNISVRAGAILLMALAGRCALVWQLNLLPYARAEGGLCSIFIAHRHWSQSVWALALLGSAGWLLLGACGLVAGAAAFALTLLFSWHCWRKIGGFTGDTLGAACELNEIVPALVVVTWSHMRIAA